MRNRPPRPTATRRDSLRRPGSTVSFVLRRLGRLTVQTSRPRRGARLEDDGRPALIGREDQSCVGTGVPDRPNGLARAVEPRQAQDRIGRNNEGEQAIWRSGEGPRGRIRDDRLMVAAKGAADGCCVSGSNRRAIRVRLRPNNTCPALKTGEPSSPLSTTRVVFFESSDPTLTCQAIPPQTPVPQPGTGNDARLAETTASGASSHAADRGPSRALACRRRHRCATAASRPPARTQSRCPGSRSPPDRSRPHTLPMAVLPQCESSAACLS